MHVPFVACDFCVAVTSTFRVLYVLVILEHHSRRLIHCNVTAYPTAQWTRQQLREAVGCAERYDTCCTIVMPFSRRSWMNPSSDWGCGC
jgi:hypothetical protein